jgi:hypothetical protein
MLFTSELVQNSCKIIALQQCTQIYFHFAPKALINKIFDQDHISVYYNTHIRSRALTQSNIFFHIFQFFSFFLVKMGLFLGSIRSSCHTMPGRCHDRPCLHGGICTEGCRVE